MSKLTDFFPQSSGSSSSKNATILLVGGGGGGGAGYVYVCGPAVPATNYCTEGGPFLGFGGGGGGVYIGKLTIEDGCTYPVVVGAGGACGCMKPDCAGEPGGAGSPGGLSRFGAFVVGGGGGAGTICIPTREDGGGTTPLTGIAGFHNVTTKYVANQIGSNFGSFGSSCWSKCGPSFSVTACEGVIYQPGNQPYDLAGYSTISERGSNLGVHVDITEFHTHDECSAGGGFQGFNVNPFVYCDETNYHNVSVADGAAVESNNGCWKCGYDIVPSFFGLALIPCDTCNSSCKERIVYCNGPSCCYPSRPDAGPGASGWDVGGCAYIDYAQCCMICAGKWPASIWTLGNSRIGSKWHGRNGQNCVCAAFWPNCLTPPIANTGSGGFNQACRPSPQWTGQCGSNCFNLSNPCYQITANGDAGVVYVVYDCSLGAASSTPGAVDCTPVTGPKGYRSYRYTSSGSFTL